MKKIHQWLMTRVVFYKHFIEVSQKVSLPGLEGQSIYNVTRFFLNELTNVDMNLRARSLAFNFFLALFPAIIFFFTLIAYIPIESTHEDIIGFFQDILPSNAFSALEFTLQDVLKNQHGSLLSFGVVLAMYFSTNGIHSMMSAFNKYANLQEKRSFILQRLIAIMLTLILSSLIIVGIVLITLGEYGFSLLYEHDILNDTGQYIMLTLLKWVVVVLLFLTVFSFLYYFGPSKSKKWRFISPGSTVATILSIITTLGFAYYVNNFGSYNKLYGSLGALIVIMLLIYFNSFILLVGFELNSSIDRAKKIA